MTGSEMWKVSCEHDPGVEAVITPLQSSLDVGAGPGKPLSTTLRGGVVGLVFDTRGRPIRIPTEQSERVPLLEKWVAAMDEYPDGGKG